MKKGTKRLFAVAAGAAVGTAAVRTAHNTARNMADMAMNRELTEQQSLLMQAAPGSPKEQELEKQKDAAAERLRDSACQAVEITAHDGIRLIGHLHLAESPKRTIIAVHGWRASWTGRFGLIADFLYENGCNVLYIEQRAHGASGGKYIGFGLLERYDVLDWIDWVNEQDFACFPIYLFGFSMGAATVLMTAGESLPDNVHGVIADSGYTSPRDEWKYVAENNMHCNYKLMEKYVDKLAMERIGCHADEYSSTQAMQECRTPVLFIHGTADTFVPIEMTYENYKACAAPKRLMIIPGAGHCQGYQLEPERYEEELRRFWQELESRAILNRLTAMARPTS
ncbi:MAG: alpha/beta hydrolase [Lachnospiraceae bacterium]|nr:alpha/beta hydrolase [Lachnospiraceae bacterium]